MTFVFLEVALTFRVAVTLAIFISFGVAVTFAIFISFGVNVTLRVVVIDFLFFHCGKVIVVTFCAKFGIA